MSESKASRRRGLLLMTAGALTFVGTTTQMLPAQAFFPAVGVCVLGVLLFMRDNRQATTQEEARIRRRLDPELRNQSMDRFAERQAGIDGRALESLASHEGARVPARRTGPPPAEPEEIVLYDVSESEPVEPPTDDEDALAISPDVSFPLELQASQSLAEELQKLDHLRAEGVLTSEEFAIAKAKLLA